MKLNDIVWTCKNSIESESYEKYDPHKPYAVKITSIYNDPSIPYVEVPKNEPNHEIRVIASRFNKETGEADNDSNATVCANPSDFFLTKEEAIEHYKELLQQKIYELRDTLNSYEA